MEKYKPHYWSPFHVDKGFSFCYLCHKTFLIGAGWQDYVNESYDTQRYQQFSYM
jgi:hypothetical protein